MQTSLSYVRDAAYLCPEPNLRKVTATAGQTELPIIAHFRDEAVYEQLFRKFHPVLCRYAFGMLKDIEASEEVVQDVFLKIWEKRNELEITVSVKAYLYRAVHNSCLNRIDKKKREVRMDEVPLKVVHQASAPVADIQSRELEKAIADAMQQLPEQCRKVFELSRFGDMKYKEIADTLGISIKTVENQMGKALRIMREQLAPYIALGIPFLFHLLQLNTVL